MTRCQSVVSTCTGTAEGAYRVSPERRRTDGHRTAPMALCPACFAYLSRNTNFALYAVEGFPARVATHDVPPGAALPVESVA